MAVQLGRQGISRGSLRCRSRRSTWGHRWQSMIKRLKHLQSRGEHVLDHGNTSVALEIINPRPWNIQFSFRLFFACLLLLYHLPEVSSQSIIIISILGIILRISSVGPKQQRRVHRDAPEIISTKGERPSHQWQLESRAKNLAPSILLIRTFNPTSGQ